MRLISPRQYDDNAITREMKLYIQNHMNIEYCISMNSDLCHEWGNSATIKIMSKNHCRIASRVTKIVVNANEHIISFLTRYFMSWTHKSAKNHIRSLISPLSPRTVFADLALWRHHSWSVTVTRTRDTGIMWRYIPGLLLHAHIGADDLFRGVVPTIKKSDSTHPNRQVSNTPAFLSNHIPTLKSRQYLDQRIKQVNDIDENFCYLF